jgi:hypothetical protein
MSALDKAFLGIRKKLICLSENQSKSQCEGSSAQHVYTSPVSSLGVILKQHYEGNLFQEFFQPFGQNFNVIWNDVSAKMGKHGVYKFLQGKENPSAQDMHQDDRDSPDNHEELFKSMIEQMVAELSLKNNRFFEERPKLDMQRQMAKRRLRCQFP